MNHKDGTFPTRCRALLHIFVDVALHCVVPNKSKNVDDTTSLTTIFFFNDPLVK